MRLRIALAFTGVTAVLSAAMPSVAQTPSQVAVIHKGPFVTTSASGNLFVVGLTGQSQCTITAADTTTGTSLTVLRSANGLAYATNTNFGTSGVISVPTTSTQYPGDVSQSQGAIAGTYSGNTGTLTVYVDCGPAQTTSSGGGGGGASPCPTGADGNCKVDLYSPLPLPVTCASPGCTTPPPVVFPYATTSPNTLNVDCTTGCSGGSGGNATIVAPTSTPAGAPQGAVDVRPVINLTPFPVTTPAPVATVFVANTPGVTVQNSPTVNVNRGHRVTLTSSSSTTCTSISTTATTLASITNSGAAMGVYFEFYDEGTSPSCSTADAVYGDATTTFLGLGQVVTLSIPLTSGLAYKLSGSLTSNLVVVTLP